MKIKIRMQFANGDLEIAPKRIDLFRASKELKEEFNIKYMPEETGVPGMFIIVDDISFCINSSGKFTTYGKTPLTKRKIAMQTLFNHHLKHFLI